MIEITYNNGITDIFEIYTESSDYIIWKDHARNFIRINKHSGQTSLLHNNEWIEHNQYISSYKKV